MATFRHRMGRRKIFFTNHALDQWWARCEANDLHGRQQAMNLLRQKLDDAVWRHDVPPWAKLTIWHKARAEGWISIDDDEGAFIVNRAEDRNLVAVTYLVRPSLAAAA